MTNQLAQHLTTWKAWYAALALPAFLLGSLVALLGGFADGADEATRENVMGLLIPVQFIALAAIALGLIALVARAWPTTRDLGLKRTLSWREIALLVVVFVVSHGIFWLLSLGAPSDPGQARRYFEETGLGGPIIPAVAAIIASVILAPVCEELLYRGAVLRPIHDALARSGRPWLGAALGILASSLLFAMPHLGGSLTGPQALSYLVTGIAFGLVYVLTGSMTAAMVSHSLQSCFAYAQILLLGRGDDTVSPLIYVIVFGCPLWTYLCARALHAVFPLSRA